MKFLLTTDIHGDIKIYNWLIKNQDKADVFILGADILPKHNISSFKDLREKQTQFLNGYFIDFIEQIKTPTILDFGNDDLIELHQFFKDLVNRDESYLYYSEGRCLNFGGWHFYGMNYIPNHPFRLKDWVARDTKDSGIFPILTKKVYSEGKEKTHNDFVREVMNSETIQDKLNKLPITDIKRTLCLFHSPPSESGLDRCTTGQEVGSKAIRWFLENNSPFLSFHGHIHESPFVPGGFYKTIINNTICLNPGRNRIHTTIRFIIIDIPDISKVDINKYDFNNLKLNLYKNIKVSEEDVSKFF